MTIDSASADTPNVNSPSGFKLRNIYRGHNGVINEMVWSPNGDFLASVADDAKCIIWNIKTGESNHQLEKHITPLYCVAWSNDGRRVR